VPGSYKVKLSKYDKPPASTQVFKDSEEEQKYQHGLLLCVLATAAWNLEQHAIRRRFTTDNYAVLEVMTKGPLALPIDPSPNSWL